MKYSEIIKTYFKGFTDVKLTTNLITYEVTADTLIETCLHFYKTHKLPLKTIKAVDERKENGTFKIYYIFGIPNEEYFPTVVLSLKESVEFPSLIKEIHEATYYETEIASFFGLIPVGNPNQQQFILQENWPLTLFPLRKDFDWKSRPAMVNNEYSFHEIQGEGIYEIPVGPIHAGIIEPGHFRFSVAGEEIVNLEPQLGYTHKGSEKLFEILPLDQKVRLSERISGDTSCGHAIAFCEAIEKLSDTTITKRSQYIRIILLELERIANHINDVGFILNDTAFSFGGSNGQRLKERVMQLNQKITGSRFLRGSVCLGGVTSDIDDDMQVHIKEEIMSIQKDFSEVVAIAIDSETVINRLKKSGILNKNIAADHGVVGVAARASGIATDARVAYHNEIYSDLGMKIVTHTTGDVYARFMVRIEEVSVSTKIILRTLDKLKKNEQVKVPLQTLGKNLATVSIIEGWRGDIVYFVMTNNKGEITRVGVRDVSFLNWMAVPYAVVGNIVPDFPLINKSFNLSYSGFDR